VHSCSGSMRPAARIALALALSASPWTLSFSAPRALGARPLTSVVRRGASDAKPSAAEESAPSMEEDAAALIGDARLEASFGRAAVGTWIMAASMLPGQWRSVPAVLCAIASLQVLRNAASRDRLSGGTFRMLCLGLLAGFSAMLFNSGCQVMELTLRSQGVFNVRSAIRVAATIFASVSGLGAAYRALEDHGLPKFKTEIRAAKGRRWLLTLVAAGCAFTAVQQLVIGGVLLFYSRYKAVGALRCFVISACAHVCQTAAVAGPKRLSSETYGLLNAAVALDAVVRLSLWVGTEIGVAALPAAPALVTLLSAGVGLLIGKLYTPEK